MKHLTPEPPRWLILSKALEETRSENRKLTGRLEKRDERIRALEVGLREVLDAWKELDGPHSEAAEVVWDLTLEKAEDLLAGQEGK